MASVLFNESDFEADIGTGKGIEEEPCPRSECVAAREDLERLNTAAPPTIRSGEKQALKIAKAANQMFENIFLQRFLLIQIFITRVRVYLCFYCRFEDEDRLAMRGHFREAHDMRVQVDDDSERGEDEYEDGIYDREQEEGEVDLQNEEEQNQDNVEYVHDTAYDDCDEVASPKPTIISILKTPKKQSIKPEEPEPDGFEDFVSSLNPKSEEPSLPEGGFHKGQVFPNYQELLRVIEEYERQSNMRFKVRDSKKETNWRLDKEKFPKRDIYLVCQHSSRQKVLKYYTVISS